MSDEVSELNTKAILARGWAKSGIKRFLGSPHRVQNCRSKTFGDYVVNWYLESAVLSSENKAEFKAFQEKKEARAVSSQKAVATKIEKAIETAKSIKIGLERHDLGWLKKQACESYNDYHSDYCPDASTKSDHKFLDRITVNFIRHELSNYEDALWAQFGKTGGSEAVRLIRHRVYMAIATTYPSLKQECEDQEARRSGVSNV